jgi:hypothetical protein
LLTNRVVIDKSILVRSVNGPVLTRIAGYSAPGSQFGSSVRCSYVATGAVLSGFTLTNGATLSSTNASDTDGGAVWCESPSSIVSNCIITGSISFREGGGAAGGTLINCTIVGNTASQGGGGATASFLSGCLVVSNSAKYAGGVSISTLTNCVLFGNGVALGHSEYGGGAAFSTLYNCTLVSNYVATGNVAGGAYNSFLYNCIVYGNPGGEFAGSTLNFCCTSQSTTAGTGNFNLAPLFVDQGHLNLRLQSNSPCINSGNSSYSSAVTDLAGNPRISGGAVDVGAYEFQGPTSLISYSWLRQYGLTNNGSADFKDPDGDGMNNWQEWRCGTNPTNALSVLRLLPPQSTDLPFTLTWQSVTNRSYFIQRADNSSPFSTIAENIPGLPLTTSFTDTTASGDGPFLYRIGVEP